MSDFEGTENLLKTLAGKLKSSEATVAIRPEDITILTEEPPVSQEWNLLEGEVQEYTDLGPVVNVAVEVGFVLKALLDKRSFWGSSLAVGTRVYVRFDVDSGKVFNAHCMSDGIMMQR